MSDISSWDDPADPTDSMRLNSPGRPELESRPRRKRRGLRIAIASVTSFVVLVGAITVGGYLFLNHLAGSIQRVPVSFAKLDLPSRPTHGMTVLITGAGVATSASTPSGLIMLLHINADQQAGGVVSIPSQVIVRVPGHGRTEIENALVYGGPSLLALTVERLTHVRIDHYARIDFAHVSNLVNAVGGVNVILPETTVSFGHVFHQGVNHLNGTTALYYARQPTLTEEGRVLRQQSLIRAVLRKIAHEHLLIKPVTAYHVVQALISMLTVDSNFTNSELAALAAELKGLSSSAGTFLTAPEHLSGGHEVLNTGVSDKLWTAINHGSLAAFARQYPSTVTPATAP